jgi:hypothetical protein
LISYDVVFFSPIPTFLPKGEGEEHAFLPSLVKRGWGRFEGSENIEAAQSVPAVLNPPVIS